MTGYVPHRPMMAHQAEFFDRFKDAEYAALFWEQRTRKTKPVLDTFAYNLARGRVDALCVVAYPSDVHRVWAKDELPKDLSPELLERVAVLSWDSSKSQTDRYRRAMADLLSTRPAILTLNCEVLISETCWAFLRRFFAAHRVLLVADESSFAANWSKRTKRLLAMGRGRTTVMRRILDGTPADEGPFDLYYPTQFLRPGLLGFDSALAFRNHHAEFVDGYNRATGVSFRQVKVVDGAKQYRNLDELNGKLLTFGTRWLRSQLSDAPPKLYQTRPFELSPRQRAVYDRLRDEYEAQLDGRTVRAVDVLLRLTRLQMIARNYYPPEVEGVPCGACGGDGSIGDAECVACSGLGIAAGRTPLLRIDPDRNPAAEALCRELEATRGPVVVWGRFVQDVADAAAASSRVRGHRRVGRYDGTVPRAAREEAYEAFKAGGIDVIVATIQSGLSRGHDLRRARALVYYSNLFALRDRRQSEDRAEDLDKDESTDVVDLVALDTRDEDVTRALRDKRAVAEVIMGDDRGRNLAA